MVLLCKHLEHLIVILAVLLHLLLLVLKLLEVLEMRQTVVAHHGDQRGLVQLVGHRELSDLLKVPLESVLSLLGLDSQDLFLSLTLPQRGPDGITWWE